MSPVLKQYYAFISYKRDDQKWAEWLQEKLEHYKLPSNLNGRDSLPKEIRPIFRDKSELAAGVLADEIQKALDNSKYLIVICSPHSAKSEWVNKEVQAFIDSGRTDKIIPFIIEGVPNSGNDETECFPKAIRELPAEDELLGVNINEMGRDAAAVKVVAQMFGLRFDDLWQRHEREKKRRRNWIITASVVAFLVMVGIAGWIWHQNVKLKEKDWKMMESQSRFGAKSMLSGFIDNPDFVKMFAVEMLPDDMKNPNRPFTMEAEQLLRKSYECRECYVAKYDGCLITGIGFNDDETKLYIRIIRNLLRPSLIVLDVATGVEERTIECSDFGYDDISIDGKQALKIRDGIVNMFDVETGAVLHTFDKYKNVAVVQYKKNNYLHIGTNQDQHFIHLNTGKELLKNCLIADVSQNGKKVCYFNHTNDNKLMINVCEMINGGKTMSWISDVNYSHGILNYDGSLLLAKSDNGEITLWNTENRNKIITANILSEDTPQKISLDGKMFATVNRSGYVKIWDAETLQMIDGWRAHGDDEWIDVTFDSKNEKIVTRTYTTIKIWDMNASNNPKVLTKVCNIMDIDEDYVKIEHDHVLYFTKDRSEVFLYDIKTGQEMNRKIEFGELFGLLDNKHRFFHTDDNTIVVWDEESKHTIHKFVVNDIKEPFVSSDGKWLCTLSYNENVCKGNEPTEVEVNVFNIETGENTSSLRFETNMEGNNISLSSLWDNGKYMALLDEYDVVYDNLIKNFIVIDLETGEKKSIPCCQNQGLAHFSSDGNYIATHSLEMPDKVRILDAHNGEIMHFLEGEFSWHQNNPFSPDSHYIMTIINEKKRNVYDITTGNCVHTIERENDTLIAASFTDDGRHIITVSSNGDVCQWNFPPLQELIDQTRERFKNRPLTEEERKMYYLE